MQIAEKIWPNSERTIKKLIDLEFDIYKYHSRELSFAKKLEMLPVIIHSLIQQLILQNPVFYSVIVALQPDYITRFMTFPYYT
jgi:hypothetical protein